MGTTDAAGRGADHGNALTARRGSAAPRRMTSARYGHLPPKQLVPRLADEGQYLASESTMYRLQKRFGLGAHRRPVLRTHVTRGTTVHRATRANQLWSWDITYLPTTIRGRFLRLYLVMDVWSRRIVGWEVHEDEVADHAATLIQRICAESGIDPKGLVLHSDNGKPMRGQTMVATLQWLGIVPSFSRPARLQRQPVLRGALPHAQAHAGVPAPALRDREAARRWVARFVGWYNSEHHHSGIRYVTPDERHSGADIAILARRHALYEQARRRKPERWSRNTRNWTPLGTVVLNPEPSQLALWKPYDHGDNYLDAHRRNLVIG